MNQKLKRASEYFGISDSAYAKSGAFNPVIGVDSLFFVDSLLLSKTKVPEFKDALAEVRIYFSGVITLLRTENKKAREAAHKKLILREVRGIGIGYGNKRDDGSAIGPELARHLMLTAEELIKMGVNDPAIFEVMGLFEEDFGPDRLSDGLIRILLHRIYTYSERVTKELKIKEIFIQKTCEHNYTLAKHPLKDGPLIFLPQGILRDLPLATSFEDISVVAAFNDELRQKFNSILAACFTQKDGKKPKKSEIRRYLLETKDRISTVVAAYQACNPEAYDFESDPAGLYLWPEKAKELVKANPLSIPTKPKKKEDLEEIVQKIINAFKKFIETKGGWRSLYNDSKEPLNESHARHFFYATALLYCESSDIDISPESNAGQGPVDFKLSTGHKEKIIVEVKLTSGHVRQGYEKQTRIYEESEEAKASYFVVVQVIGKSKVLEEVLRMEEEEEKEGKKHPTIIVVDGREKPSASKA
ncbi:MAG: hypothetical protein V4665_03230 [Patescibacteria group bacterium]